MSYRLERLGTPFFLSDTVHRTEALSQIQEAMSAGTPVTLAPAHMGVPRQERQLERQKLMPPSRTLLIKQRYHSERHGTQSPFPA